MIRLAGRLAVGGGREALVRLLLTAVGLALATAMLLCAAVTLPALRAHDVRRGWMSTSAHNERPSQDEGTADPLLWRLTELRYDGRDMIRVDLAATGPNAPVPPGLDAVPSAGQLAVSPALRRLLERTDPEELAERFPGEVTATIGQAALASPEDLVVFVGRSPDDLRPGQNRVSTVRSIETAPVTRTLTRAIRLTVAVGVVGLLAPVIVFVATATRLAAARRERRLAAMRLAGATPRQIGIVAAVEATAAAVAGTIAGFLVFLGVRPSLANLPLDGASFYPSDLRLPVASALAVLLGVPVIAAVTAVVSLHRARIEPLAAARHAPPAQPSPRSLLFVLAGLVGLIAVQATMSGASDVAVASAVGAALLAMVAGIVLSGAWLTSLVGRALARTGRRAPSLLAARRLQDNPKAAFRAIGGLVLAVFVGTVLSSLTASTLSDASGPSDDGLRTGVLTAVAPLEFYGEPPANRVGEGSGASEDVSRGEAARIPAQGAPLAHRRGLEPAQVERIVQNLEPVPGVHGVAAVYGFPDGPEADRLAASQPTGAIRWGPPHDLGAMLCVDAAAIGLAPCAGTTAVALDDTSLRATGTDITGTIPVHSLGGGTVVGVAAITDGSAGAVERARTVLERAIPGSVALTQADHDAKNQATARTTERISNLALAVTLVIAGCSLAVAVAGSIAERRQPFALLRLAGTRVSDLRRVVLTEAALPLVVATLATATLGLGVTALTLGVDSTNPSFAFPGLGYWLAVLGGLGVALSVVAATMPLLNRVTAPDAVRFE